jgi:hypothetical protein
MVCEFSLILVKLINSLIRRTISIFLNSDDMTFAIEFFKELLLTMPSLPPLSLSTYWKPLGYNIVGIPLSVSLGETKSILPGHLDQESPLLGVPDLAYLIPPPLPHADSVDYAISPTSLLPPKPSSTQLMELEFLREEHDPLGVVQRLSDTAEGLFMTVSPANLPDRAALLSLCLALGVKSGRASLLLSAAHLLSSSSNLLPYHMDSVVRDLIQEVWVFVGQTKVNREEKEKKDTHFAYEAQGDEISHIRASLRR